MNEASEACISEHERVVECHYDNMTEGYYLNWHPDHIHLGLFEPGECPQPGETLRDSAGLARAVERMVDVIVAPAGIEQHHHVVDAGCGVGGTAIRLAKTRGCAVTGVNLSRLHLEIAGKKAVEAGLDDRISFKYADCSRSLPFADGSIDAVVNIESACHYSDRGRFLHEVHRILKPGGRIAAMDWMARDGLSAAQYDEYIRPLCESWAMVSLESQSTYTRKLHEADLEILEFEGFNGKEMDNLKLLDNNYRNCMALFFSGLKTPGFLKLTEGVGRWYAAWQKGYFEIRRYCARKPE